jgi:hypothetical protein
VSNVKRESVGFVIIACGPFAHSLKAEVFIESLVKHGKWNRKIFVITDLPNCFDVDWIRRVAGSPQIHILSVPMFSHRLDFPIAMRKLKWAGVTWPVPGFVHAYTRRRALSLKAEIFEVLPLEHSDIEVLVYCDCDAIVSHDNEMARLESIATNWNFGEGIIFWMKNWQRALDQGVSCRELKIFGGLFIAHRILSARALKEWKATMSMSEEWINDHTDFDKYCRAMDRLSAAGAQRNFMKAMPIPDFEPMVRVLGPKAPTMIGHITLRRLLAEGKQFYEQQIAGLGLKSCEPGYYTMPFLPGWVIALYFLGWWPYGG